MSMTALVQMAAATMAPDASWAATVSGDGTVRTWGTGVGPRLIRRAVAIEAGHFQGAGLPTIVCGPGSIDMAHKPDEFVDEAQLVVCLEFLERLAEDLSR